MADIPQQKAQEKTQQEGGQGSSVHRGATWGPKLFVGVLIVTLVFFWWLLIYSGGVEIHHG